MYWAWWPATDTMNFIHKFAKALASLLPDTQAEREASFLAASVDHADLEYRLQNIASNYLSLYPAGSGR